LRRGDVDALRFRRLGRSQLHPPALWLRGEFQETLQVRQQFDQWTYVSWLKGDVCNRMDFPGRTRLETGGADRAGGMFDVKKDGARERYRNWRVECLVASGRLLLVEVCEKLCSHSR
jgi:hypothetical protein